MTSAASLKTTSCGGNSIGRVVGLIADQLVVRVHPVAHRSSCLKSKTEWFSFRIALLFSAVQFRLASVTQLVEWLA